MDVDESMVRGLILVLLFVPIRENTSNPHIFTLPATKSLKTQIRALYGHDLQQYISEK